MDTEDNEQRLHYQSSAFAVRLAREESGLHTQCKSEHTTPCITHQQADNTVASFKVHCLVEKQLLTVCCEVHALVALHAELNVSTRLMQQNKAHLSKSHVTLRAVHLNCT